MKAHIIQQPWVDEQQGEIRHATQLHTTINLKSIENQSRPFSAQQRAVLTIIVQALNESEIVHLLCCLMKEESDRRRRHLERNISHRRFTYIALNFTHDRRAIAIDDGIDLFD